MANISPALNPHINLFENIKDITPIRIILTQSFNLDYMTICRSRKFDVIHNGLPQLLPYDLPVRTGKDQHLPLRV